MDVKLPKLGEGADSGVVVNIFVKEGDTVAKDQAIMELENEKAVASIPSTAAGIVDKIYVKVRRPHQRRPARFIAGGRHSGSRCRSARRAGAKAGGQKSRGASRAGT